MEDTKISIIIPTYNAGAVIEGAVKSVIAQTYINKEILIIDGGSTDGTIGLLDKYREHIKYMVSEHDNGIYDAMNKGIKAASGDFIYFLGADDRFSNENVLSDIFSKRLPKGAAGMDIIYGNVRFIPTGRIYDGAFDPMKLAKANICHQAMFIRRDIFKKYGYYDLRYPYLADWAFNIKHFCDPNIKYGYLDIIIADYYLKGSSSRFPDHNFRSDQYKLFIKYLPPEVIENLIKERDEKLDVIYRSFGWKIAKLFINFKKK